MTVTARAWRDTINLVPGERVEILIPFRDFAGKSVFHCHIAEHGDAGMMGISRCRARRERAAAPLPRLRVGALPGGLSERQAGIVALPDQPARTQLADQPRPGAARVAVSGRSRAAPTSAALYGAKPGATASPP